MGYESVITREFLQSVFAYSAEKHYRIVIGFFPEITVDASEKFQCVRIPHPPKIVSDIEKRL